MYYSILNSIHFMFYLKNMKYINFYFINEVVTVNKDISYCKMAQRVCNLATFVKNEN